MRVSLDGVRVGYGSKEVVHGFTGCFETGDVVSILGPNGSGKSTLIRAIAGLSQVMEGTVSIDDTNIQDYSLDERTKIIAYIPQSHSYMPYTTVMDTVLTGRCPYVGRDPSEEDPGIVQELLDIMDVGAIADRYINELSGGQRQRLFIARALAQTPRFFIFDEPTSSLDLKYQMETMMIMRDVVHESDAGAITAMHDLNLALHHSDGIYVLSEGDMRYSGGPEEVLTPDNIRDVYGVHVALADTEYGRFILPYGAVRSGSRFHRQPASDPIRLRVARVIQTIGASRRRSTLPHESWSNTVFLPIFPS